MDKHIKKNMHPLYYTVCTFIIFLFIWISVINMDSDKPLRSTLDNIQKGKQAVEELKQEVYTRESEVIHDDTEGSSLQGLPAVGTDAGSFLVDIAPGVGAFIIILGVFGGAAAIIYAVISAVRR